MHMNASISVIIPVLHETDRINRTIQHLRELEGSEDLEIIVVDGDQSGSTNNLITDRRVIMKQAGKGRGSQMNKGALVSSGSLLLFLHCDTRLPPNGLTSIRAALRNGRYKAGAFALGIDSNHPVFRITERYVAARTKLFRIPFGDQAIFMRREYFQHMGGFREIPVMEDVELMGRIKKRGDRICLIPQKVRTSPRRWEQEGLVYCTFRNWALQIGYALGISPQRLAKWYRFK